MNIDDSMTSKLKDDFKDYKKRIQYRSEKNVSDISDNVIFYNQGFEQAFSDVTVEDLSSIVQSANRHKDLYKQKTNFTHPKSHERLDESYDTLLEKTSALQEELEKEKQRREERKRNEEIERLGEQRLSEVSQLNSEERRTVVKGCVAACLSLVTSASLYLAENGETNIQYENALNAEQEVQQLNKEVDNARGEAERWGVDNPERHPYFKNLKEENTREKDSILSAHDVDSEEQLEQRVERLEEKKDNDFNLKSAIAFISGLGAVGMIGSYVNGRNAVSRRRREVENLDDKIAELKNQR